MKYHWCLQYREREKKKLDDSRMTITQQHFIVDTFMSLFLDCKATLLGFALKLSTCLHDLIAMFVFTAKSYWNFVDTKDSRINKSTRIFCGIVYNYRNEKPLKNREKIIQKIRIYFCGVDSLALCFILLFLTDLKHFE